MINSPNNLYSILINPLCIASNTQILMANGELKLIQDVDRGDWVQGENIIHQVAKVHTSYHLASSTTQIYRFAPGSLSSLFNTLETIPSQPLLITPMHSIIYNRTRRYAKQFDTIDGVVLLEIPTRESLPVYHDEYIQWDLQFETVGSYYANGVNIQSRHPQSINTPLSLELYFDCQLYSDVLMNDLDEKYEYPLVFDKI